MAVTIAPRDPSGRSTGSLRGLDWLNFFLADVQTGVGPFLAIYLASLHWTQTAIGVALTVGGVVGVASQLVGGALVDAIPRKRLLLAVSILGTAGSAVLLATAPTHAFVLLAQSVIGVVASVNGPAVAAISLGIVGHVGLGPRLGRNHRFDSAGNLVAAGIMGAVGYIFASRAIFFASALFAVPTLLALRRIRPADIDGELARGGGSARAHEPPWSLLRDRPFLLFMACGVLFHFANAAMLPLLGTMLARGHEHASSLFLSACIVTTQVVVALSAPWIGRRAETIGRRPLLLLGFGVLPIRGVLYTMTTSPPLLIAIQVLDGVGAAVFGTLSALVIADVTMGSGRFNLAQGAVGVAVGVGASLSNAAAGYVVDHFGFNAAFLALSAVALVALALLVSAMPETKVALGAAGPRVRAGRCLTEAS